MAFQGDSIYWVEVEKIVPNPFQPRREFDEHKLQELADSVRMYGILQPLTVTRKEIQREDGTFYTEYELIAGERRLRASKIAGLSQVPVIIREGDDSEQEKLELAIIENLQREDLNAVDRALAFKQLADIFGLSHTQVAKKMGRSREYVSNTVRLLALPECMLNALRRGEMTEGHARTLLMLNDRPEEQDVVFREILLKKLSVREVERIVRKIATEKVRKSKPGEFDTELIEMEKRFMETLGTRVQILKTDFGGKLTIDYFSVDDLEGMLSRMKIDQADILNAQQNQSDTITAHTPITILREDEEVSSKVDDSVMYPAPIADEVNHIPAEVVPEVAVYHQSAHTPVTEIQSTLVPQPVRQPESIVEITSKVSENIFAPTMRTMIPPPVHHEQIANHQPDGYLAQHSALIPVSVPVAPPYQSVQSEARQVIPEVVQPNYAPVPNHSYISHVASAVSPVDDPIHSSVPFQQTQPVAQVSSQSQTQPQPVLNQNPMPTVAPVNNLPATPIPPKIDDDSDLYSIRNFSV